MKYAQPTTDFRTRKALSLRVKAVAHRPELLGSLVLLNLIIVILLISGMRGLLA